MFLVINSNKYLRQHDNPEGLAGGPDPSPLKNHKNIGFLSKADPDPLKNHKATKAAFNDGPSSARQQKAI